MKFRGKLTKIDVYGVSVYFYKSKKILSEDLRKLTKDYSHPLQEGVTITMEKPHYGKLFFVGVFCEGDLGLKVLAHECAHVCIHVAAHHALNYGPDSSEQFCYLMGHVFSEGQKALRL